LQSLDLERRELEERNLDKKYLGYVILSHIFKSLKPFQIKGVLIDF